MTVWRCRKYSVVVGNVRLQGLGQIQFGHGFGVHVLLAAAEQRLPYRLAAQLLQRMRLHPLRGQRLFDLEEHRSEYVVALSVTEHGAHDVRVHPGRVLAHALRDKQKNKINT